MQKLLSTKYKVPALIGFLMMACAAHAQISAVVNAASFARNRSLTPGSIVSIFGQNLSNATAFATDPLHMPNELGGTKVDVGGVSCILFYVSPKQINAQIDKTVSPGAQTLTVTSALGTFNAGITIETAGSPGVFSFSSSGTRDGAILNAVTFDRGPFTVTTGGQPTYLAIYTTGLDLSTDPVVTIGGVAVPVVSKGDAPGFTGLQQINVQLLPELAGAGRVEVAVTAGGKTSNIVEVVILPNTGMQFGPRAENTARHRELASLAWVPGKSLALLADENDDVVRILDLKALTVVKTIALPEGAEPVAVAVNAAGTLAAVAERDRAKVAIVDLATSTVLTPDIEVAAGPTSIAIAGDIAVVVSQDQDTVSLINLTSKQVVTTLTVGRGPRYVTADATANRAYVTNQDDGTISVIDIGTGTVAQTLTLGPESRPFAIRILPALGLAAVTIPSAGKEGKVVFVKLADGSVAGSVNVNPEKSGGSSDIAVFGSTVYFANQSGGSVSAVDVSMNGSTLETPVKLIRAGLGARALAIDELDSLLLVTNQGSGTVAVIKVPENQIVGRINGVRGENEPENQMRDDDNDREHAANLPTIASIDPKSGEAGKPEFTLTINGTNLTGATELNFIDPSTLHGDGKGRGMGMGGNHGHGPFGKPDQKITVTNIVVNPAGTQLTATVAIAADAAKGDRVVRVETPNGDSTFTSSAGNTFSVQ